MKEREKGSPVSKHKNVEQSVFCVRTYTVAFSPGEKTAASAALFNEVARPIPLCLASTPT